VKANSVNDEAMTRADLVRFAKEGGIKANGKTNGIPSRVYMSGMPLSMSLWLISSMSLRNTCMYLYVYQE